MPPKPTEGTTVRDVYVIGSHSTAFKKHPGMSWGDLAREAYLGTLSDAGMKNGADIETGWLGNCGMGFWGQNSIRAQALFQPLVEEGLFPERVPFGATGPDGKLPVNTSGGLVSKGHPVGATGLSMLAKLTTQ